MKNWLAALKAEACCSLSIKRKQGRGRRESKVTGFTGNTGREPRSCLRVSVSVRAHVFRFPGLEGPTGLSLCQSSPIVSTLSS